jgi:hypothetical protein
MPLYEMVPAFVPLAKIIFEEPGAREVMTKHHDEAQWYCGMAGEHAGCLFQCQQRQAIR